MKKIICSGLLSLLVLSGLSSCDNDLGSSGSKVSQAVSIATQKDNTNLSVNGHEEGILQSKALQYTNQLGYTSPTLKELNSGSKVSVCVYNGTGSAFSLDNHDSVQASLISATQSIAPNHYGCLDEVKFDNADKYAVNYADKKTTLHYRNNNNVINGDDSNTGAASILMYDGNKKAVKYIADNDLNFIRSDPRSYNLSVGYGLDNNNISRAGSASAITFWAWLILIFAIMLSAYIGMGIGFMSATPNFPMWFVGTLGFISFGSVTASIVFPIFIFSNHMSDIKEYHPTVNISTYDPSGNPLSMYDASRDTAVQYWFVTDSLSNNKYHTDKVAYTNTIQICVGTCPTEWRASAIGEDRYHNTILPEAALTYVSESSLYLSQESIDTSISKFKANKLAYQKIADNNGPSGDWRNGFTSWDATSATITDTGAVPMTLPYGRCKLGSGVHYETISQIKSGLAMPGGLYRSACKDITYDSIGHKIIANCPAESSIMLATKGKRLLGSADYQPTIIDASCSALDVNNKCISDARLNLVSPLLSVNKTCSIKAITGSGLNTNVAFSCWNADKLSSGQSPIVNPPVVSAKLLNNVTDMLYDSQQNMIIAQGNKVAAKVLACDEYNPDMINAVSPDKDILPVFGANFKSEDFNPVTGDYSLVYTSSDKEEHTLTTNVYSECSGNPRLALTLSATNGNIPQFNMSCELPASGPKAANPDMAKQVTYDPGSMVIVLKKEYQVNEYSPLMLAFGAQCRLGSQYSVERTTDPVGNDVVAIYCKELGNTKEIVEPTEGPNGSYHAKCTKVYYNNATGILNAICKSAQGDLTTSSLTTNFLNKDIDVDASGKLYLK